ncbi:MAG: DUF2339 domain-containing protein, partial [Candidatus Diapherotrites archaeon]|nr:DUF2339 domain-containing protein [Candidatus Diapherotrites archaeon]
MLPLITQKLDFFMLIYALILLAAIIALFTRKRWAVVYFEGIAATFFLYAVWTLKNFGYEAAQAGDIVLFMMGFYALFSIGAILFASEKKNFLAGATLHLFASIWFYWAISDIFTVHFPGLHLLFRIAFLLIALLLAAFARKSLSIQKSDWHVVVPFAAAGFLTLFNVMPLLMMLIAFSLFFVVFASREEHTLLVPARLVSVVAFVFVFATLFWLKNFSFDDLWAYSRMFLFVVSAPVFYLLWLESKKLAEKLNDGTKDLVAPAYFAGASLLILEFISLEINASVFEPTIRSTLISVVWVALAIAYVLYGFRAKLKESRITGFGFFAFAIMKVVLFDLSHLEIFYRIISFFVLGIVLLAAAFLYKKYEKQFA